MSKLTCPNCGTAQASQAIVTENQVTCLHCLTQFTGPEARALEAPGESAGTKKRPCVPVAAGFAPPQKLPKIPQRKPAVPVGKPYQRPPSGVNVGIFIFLLVASLVCLGGGVALFYFNEEAPAPIQELALAKTPPAPGPLATNPPKELPLPDGQATSEPSVAEPPKPPAPIEIPPPLESSSPEKPAPQVIQVKAQAADVPQKPAANLKSSAAVDAKLVDRAIAGGVTFLKATQHPTGTWNTNAHGVGHAALGGLALLESKAPAGDPVVRRAASYVRNNYATLNQTYDLALAVLFLDRLGDPHDRPLIQIMALRLVAGQNAAGGWTYSCPVMSVPDMQQLFGFLHLTRPEEFQDPLFAGGPELKDPLPGSGGLPVFTNPLAKDPPGTLTHPLPKEGNRVSDPVSEKRALSDQQDPAKRLIAPGPEAQSPAKPAQAAPKQPAASTTQPPAKSPPKVVVPRPEMLSPQLRGLPIVHYQGQEPNLHGNHDDNSNSQFALLALWVARRHAIPTERTLTFARKRYQQSQNSDSGWGYHLGMRSTPSMTCVGLLGLGVGQGTSSEMAMAMRNKTPLGKQDDPALAKGLQSLANFVGMPVAQGTPVPMENLYFLWSVERVAMLYNLPEIGGKDWYGWGAQILLANQRTNGSWNSGRFPGSSLPVDTSLALLFLTRSNLVRDLSENLQFFMGIVDPALSAQKNQGSR